MEKAAGFPPFLFCRHVRSRTDDELVMTEHGQERYSLW